MKINIAIVGKIVCKTIITTMAIAKKYKFRIVIECNPTGGSGKRDSFWFLKTLKNYFLKGTISTLFIKHPYMHFYKTQKARSKPDFRKLSKL